MEGHTVPAHCYPKGSSWGWTTAGGALESVDSEDVQGQGKGELEQGTGGAGGLQQIISKGKQQPELPSRSLQEPAAKDSPAELAG